jgi:hypothetical protein
MALWYVLINQAGDPASISSAPIPSPPVGMTVVEIESPGQPNVEEWFDPVSGGAILAPKSWDRAAKAWTTLIVPQIVDRVLGDLAADPLLVEMWSRLTTAQRTALRTRLSTLLGRRRYRYSNEPVDLGD